MKLAGWNAGQWMECNGSVKMQSVFPPLPGEQSESRRNGIAMHELTQRMLESMKDPEAATLLQMDVIGTTSKNGVLITDEMAQAALDATTDVMKVCMDGGLLQKMHIEETIDCSFIHPVLKALKPDCYIWNDATGVLDVWDFKFGHRLVEAFENWQLILYAAGILNMLELNGHDDQHVRVRARVFQPFGGHVDGASRVWECAASDLRTYVNLLIDGARKSMSDDAQCIPGPSCSNCTGRRGCESLQRTGYSAMDYQGSVVPAELSGLSLSTEYNFLTRYIDLMKARLTGIEEQILHDVKNGAIVPGLGIKQGYGRKCWRKDIDQDEVIMMGDLMDVDLRKPRVLETPTKCLSLGVDVTVIDAYSLTPKSKMKIVKNDETKARNVFR